jgi:hypothetical protein
MSTNKSGREALVVAIARYKNLNKSKEVQEKFDELVKKTDVLATLLEEHGDFNVTRLPYKLKNKPDSTNAVNLSELELGIRQLFFPTDKPPSQTALLFFVGHGLQKPSNPKLSNPKKFSDIFLATSSATEEEPCAHGLSLKTLHEVLRSSPVKQQIVFLESCYSGNLINITQTKAEEEEKIKIYCKFLYQICLWFYLKIKVNKKHHYHFAAAAREDETALADGLLINTILDCIQSHINNHSNFGKKTHLTSEILYKYIENNKKNGSQQFQQGIHNGRAIILIKNKDNIFGLLLKEINLISRKIYKFCFTIRIYIGIILTIILLVFDWTGKEPPLKPPLPLPYKETPKITIIYYPCLYIPLNEDTSGKSLPAPKKQFKDPNCTKLPSDLVFENNGNKITRKDGVHRIKVKYDDNCNNTEITYFPTFREIRTDQGYGKIVGEIHKVERNYNKNACKLEKDCKSEEVFFDMSNQRTSACNYRKMAINEEGERQFWNEKGNLLNDGKKCFWDEKGNLLNDDDCWILLPNKSECFDGNHQPKSDCYYYKMTIENGKRCFWDEKGNLLFWE